MVYRLSDRLQHANDRMTAVNSEPFILRRVTDVGTIERPITASPILISGDEVMAGDAAVTSIERHDFGINVSELGNLYPLLPGDILIRQLNREQFKIMSMGKDERPYVHTTSNRKRIICHTVQIKDAVA